MYKINKEIIMFGDTEVEKHKVYQNKNPVLMYDVDIHKIVVSSKFPFSKKGFKCFLGYEETRKIRLLCIILPKMSTYGRDFDETKYMFFFIKNADLLEEYKEFWGKVSNSMKNRFECHPVYNKKHIKTKMKCYEGKINSNFHGDKMPKVGFQYIFLSVILIDSVFRNGENYYLKSFQKNVSTFPKKKKTPKYITSNLEISSDEENSDQENSDEENYIEE